MEKFTKIIELLLQEKADLDAQKALDIEEAVKAIEAQYAEHSVKIETMLSIAGYVEPVPETVVEVAEDEPVAETEEEALEDAEDESGETSYTD